MKNSKMARLVRWMGLWPPYLGSGVRVVEVSADARCIEVEMKLRFWNQNYMRTQFGGSLYAMVDPFYMLMLIENLGPDYVVWDKAASIRFKRPGRGRVRARFELTEAQIQAVRDEVARGGKCEPAYTVRILNDQDEVVAEVDKLLWVKRKS